MALVKLEINLSDEELITLAKQAKKVSIAMHDKKIYVESSFSPLNEFIKALGIQPGRIKVKTKEIYEAFISFYKEEVSKKKFAMELTKVFKKSSHHYYLLNLSKEEIVKQLRKIQHVEETKET